MVSPERVITGKFYFAKQSKAHAARLSVAHNGLRYRLHIEPDSAEQSDAADLNSAELNVQPSDDSQQSDDKQQSDSRDANERSGEISSLEVPSRLANTQRRIGFADGSAFITQDNEAVDALLVHSHSRLTAFIHALEGSLRAVVIGLLILFAGVYGGVTLGIPWAAERVAAQIPIDVQNRLSSDALVLLDRILLEPSELVSGEQQRVRRLALPVMAAAGFANTDLQFRTGIGPNALTLPDGTVVITDELVTLANDDQLVAVLYHELGHLEGRHILRRTLQSSFLVLGVFFLTGDVNSAELLLAIPTVVMNSAYSRNFEREADRYALEKLVANDVSIDAFAQIMAAFEEIGKRQQTVANESQGDGGGAEDQSDGKGGDLGSALLNYFTTHPLTSERIALVEEYRALEQAQRSRP